MGDSNEVKVEELGWLDEDGICIFPDDVKAVPLGYIAPGLSIAMFRPGNEERIQKAIEKGWIKFVDGNGDRYTFADYVAKYPGYPDPIFVLELQGRWPPQPKKFIKIGRS